MATTFFDGAIRLRHNSSGIIRRAEFNIDGALARNGYMQPSCRCCLVKREPRQNIYKAGSTLIEWTGEMCLLFLKVILTRGYGRDLSKVFHGLIRLFGGVFLCPSGREAHNEDMF